MNKLIIANWKMNPASQKEAEKLLVVTTKKFNTLKKIDLIICLPFPFLFLFKKNKIKKISLGSQNSHNELEGSYTGEVSPKMLVDFGVKSVIVGHGERRKLGEDDVFINHKVLSLIKNKISPILCIGEKNRDGDGNYLSFIEDQIKKDLNGLPKAQLQNIVIAYEPLWAIGKDAVREATPEEFVEVKIFIKKVISDLYDLKSAHGIKVVYGGSINANNAKSFLEAGADGLLVGRDSINPNKFEALLDAIK
jgi:triosephosphate isomerase